jgi:hypothetical protein
MDLPSETQSFKVWGTVYLLSAIAVPIKKSAKLIAVMTVINLIVVFM